MSFDVAKTAELASAAGYRLMPESEVKQLWDKSQELAWRNEIVSSTCEWLAEKCLEGEFARPTIESKEWELGIADEIVFWWRYIATRGADYGNQEYVASFKNPQKFTFGHKFADSEKKVLHVLDIGAGIVSEVGTESERWQIEHVAVDPLAPAYTFILEMYDLMPPNPVIHGHAERLKEMFPTRRFDLVHAKNCLDHMYDPILAVNSMASVMEMGGKMVLRHWVNEAEFEDYRGLHQWNLSWEDGQLVMWNRSSRVVFDHKKYGLKGLVEFTTQDNRDYFEAEFTKTS